jgi:acetyl esterase/lipase
MNRPLIVIALCMPAVFQSSAVSAAELQEIVLWPEGVPEPRVPTEPAEAVEKKADGIARRSNVSNPRIVVYDIPRTDAAKLRGAVLVVPGGGFGILADEHEGSDVCRFLNEHGIVAFLVLHRVPTGKMPVPNAAPVQDIHKAVQEVRRRAAEFQLDPARIAVLGFSAGGQATLVAATNSPRVPASDAAVSARPDAVLLLYAWKVAGEGNQGVRSDVTIDATAPPMFIAQCGDDATSTPAGSVNLYLELVKAKVPAEIHIYEKGGHGYGLKARHAIPGQFDWKDRAIDWLRTRGW